ncbi:ABC transporter permease [Pseudoalteromonas sp. A25]|uniref:FtsX-like permease family protein n=1 Tax=Pseudoalteromonas sp. A25 TaxID=116092 RepID=UPI0012607411|nr:FtsX-like permease family protein [Pseudoalteromonas sp. A25]BBN82228.1 ABC transporter permease [Pseudoalteromonas sp. A25]
MVALSNELKLVVATHGYFYRRHPWLLILFLLGLSLGSALLTAISGLNQEAKARYESSSALVNNPISHLVKPLIGEPYLSGQVWITLRRNGFVSAQPVLRGTLRTQKGRSIAIQGVDTLQWLARGTQIRAEHVNEHGHLSSFATLMVDSQYKERLLDEALNIVEFEFKQAWPQPKVTFNEGIGFWALTDLAYADQLLDAKGQLSFIELSDISDEQAMFINALLAGKARLVKADQQNFDVLSQAFFFNLTALATLGYVVAAFLSFNAIKLTLSARAKLLTQMHVLGCSKEAISLGLALELIILSLLTALLGSLGGFLIANALVVDVNRTLMSLYQLDKALVVQWQWVNVLLGFVLNLMALTVMLVAQTKRFARQAKRAFYAALVIVLGLLTWLSFYAKTDIQALALCLCLMLLFVLVVPTCLHALFNIRLELTHPLMQWLYGDTRYHIQDLRIAVIAILVALGSAIGMQVMVQSFSNTLNAHLEKQLSADIYLPLKAPDLALEHELNAHYGVFRLSTYRQSEGVIGTLPAKLASYGLDHHHYQHISLTSAKPVSKSHFDNQGCLANEQSKIKYGITLGQSVKFVQNEQAFTCRVNGFFYDYGNPTIAILTLEPRLLGAGLHSHFYGYSVKLNKGITVAQLSEYLVNELSIDSTLITPNRKFKQLAKSLFDDTFVVTKALNGFILAIALLSLCTSLLSLSAQQLKQLIILQNLGVTQRQILIMKLLQTTAIVFFTACFAIPLGLALGAALLKFVMPIAFGWTIHFSWDLGTLVFTCLILIAVSMICAYLPIRKMAKKSLSGS